MNVMKFGTGTPLASSSRLEVPSSSHQRERSGGSSGSYTPRAGGDIVSPFDSTDTVDRIQKAQQDVATGNIKPEELGALLEELIQKRTRDKTKARALFQSAGSISSKFTAVLKKLTTTSQDLSVTTRRLESKKRELRGAQDALHEALEEKDAAEIELAGVQQKLKVSQPAPTSSAQQEPKANKERHRNRS